MTWFLVTDGIKLLNKKSNSYDYQSSYTDYEQLGRVGFEDSGVLLVFQKFQKAGLNGKPISQVDIDWENAAKSTIISMTQERMNIVTGEKEEIMTTTFRPCTREDFEKVDYGYGYDLLEATQQLGTVACINGFNDMSIVREGIF